MTKVFKLAGLFQFIAFWLAIAAACATAGEPPAKPFVWQTATPESQGMSSAKLEALWVQLVERHSSSLLVIRNDRIVFEKYAPEWNANKPHGTASLAKALVAGMSLAVAITDDKIALDEPASKYISQWRDDPLKSKILIRHLGSHTSGLEDAEEDNVTHDKLTGWKGDFWKRPPPPSDPFSVARDIAPVIFPPGAKNDYSNTAIAMLTYCVTASLKGSPQEDVRSLLRDRIMHPIGLADAQWSVGYNHTIAVDGLPLVPSWGGGSYTPRAVATIGRLVLREGEWDGRRLVSSAAIEQVTGDAGLPGACGMGWFTNARERYPYMPRDARWGAGAGDQVLLVIPSLQLIVVRNGETLAAPPSDIPADQKRDMFVRYHDPRAKILFEPLIGAITDPPAKNGRGLSLFSESTANETTKNGTVRLSSDGSPIGDKLLPQSLAPYPKSKSITGIEWAPAASIVTRAKDSDNWPLAWGDDNRLYTAYGDGTGFDPKVPEKLSMGLAHIEGGPDDPRGENIRSPTAERKGNGAKGLKASGMLMVDGVLYMWVRNAANSQLAWSSDHGQSWTWSDWKFTRGFGYPTFLSFGRDYAGARDEYVYIYSTDADSAYVAADQLVLARVNKQRIRERAAYQFFAGLDSERQPTWSPDIDKRVAVFENLGHCFRCAVSYDAGLKRYLLCQAGKAKPVDAGFGIFDAPQPWGPWTTVTWTDHWDVDPGEMASLPPKWMSADGKTVSLVFSGGDSFNVRAARLKTDR